MQNTELKPCPFCGTTPRIKHSTKLVSERDSLAEIMIYWQVECGNCGCSKEGGYSYYRIDDNGELCLYPKGYEKEPEDTWQTAVNKWNRRV